MSLKIITTPHPILREKSKPIKKIDRRIKALVREMILLLAKGPEGKRRGAGLSAVQTGKPLRLFITYLPQKKDYQVYINPQIISKSRKMIKKAKWLEGCLSIPALYGSVKRHLKITIAYQDLTGKKLKEEFSGFLSTVIQHEYDHLEGTLFTDRLLKQNRPIYRLEETAEGPRLVEISFQ
ncbi:peptide deformylase [Patescibacteria group bacterium]